MAVPSGTTDRLIDKLIEPGGDKRTVACSSWQLKGTRWYQMNQRHETSLGAAGNEVIHDSYGDDNFVSNHRILLILD